jgi:hypothetical protein
MNTDGFGFVDFDRMFRAELNASYNIKFRLGDMKRYLKFSGYFGKNLMTKLATFDSDHQFLSMSGVQGSRDLFLEQYYFERGGVQQQMDGMGNFYSTSAVGTNRNWIASLTSYLALPVKPNVFGLFYNQGFYPGFEKVEYMYNAGAAFIIGDIFGLYFPLVRSSNMGKLYTDNYLKEIRLTLQFNIVANGFNLGKFIN